MITNILLRNNVALRENIIYMPDFEAAAQFIIKELSENQGHIDLIITADYIDQIDFDIHLVDRIRDQYTELEYSNRNFKVSSLSVILYGENIQNSDYLHRPFNARVEKHAMNNQYRLVRAIRSVVKTSRAEVIDDLESLKISLADLQTSVYMVQDLSCQLHIRDDPRYFASRTKILSESFIRTPRRLEYDWLNPNLTEWECAIDKYEQIIKNMARYNKVDSEKNVLHSLYNQNHWLLRLDLYRKPLYEPALMKNVKEYEEPDYILPSAMPGYIPTNITEVKPHLFPILHKRKRKPGFMHNYQDAMVQVSDYERHLRKKNGRQQLDRIVDYKTSALSFTLLASNDKEMDFNEKRIEILRRDHYPKIKLETHDDRLEKVVSYYERLLWLKN